ncbi:cytochrome P450 9e2 [Trichonephila clavipes]|nr:cytochrome P450 9e2 [Trichonephila clavipes]
MDDNATCHRTLAVQDCLDSEGIQRLVWPARFPDLNPIENVWDALGRQVAGRNYPPTNKNTLIRALTEECDKLPQQLLDNVVQSMVRNDFLQLLMDTAKEVSDEEKWEDNDKGDIATNYEEQNEAQQMFKTTSNKKLSMDELIAQCVVFFLAGYETTASTLSFATYMLALNQDIQNKLRAEVDHTLAENNGELTYQAINNMKYLDNVISETLRLFPPAIRLERVADANYKLESMDITIPKGMAINIPVYCMHRDPKYYPSPEIFDPDRFTAEERAKRDPYTYLPFGAGPRNCIGMRFALMEIKICLSHVIAKFKIKRSPLTKDKLDFNLGQAGLLQPKEIIVDMEIRNDSPLVK